MQKHIDIRIDELQTGILGILNESGLTYGIMLLVLRGVTTSLEIQHRQNLDNLRLQEEAPHEVPMEGPIEENKEE